MRDGSGGNPRVVDRHPLALVPEGEAQGGPRVCDLFIDRERVEPLHLGQRLQAPSANRPRSGCQYPEPEPLGVGPVSYTHLDVYKRQPMTEAVGESSVELALADTSLFIAIEQERSLSRPPPRSCLLYTSRCV